MLTPRPLLALSLVGLIVACSDPGETVDGSGPTSSGSANGGSGAATTGNGGSSSSSGGTGGAGASVPNGVPMFVAHGHMARTTISCDGGNAWVANQSNDDSVMCWQPPNTQPDCDHDPGAGRGIGYGDGLFMATYGWGQPGGLRRSADGVSWEEVISGTTFGGVAYNPNTGAWLAAAGTPQRSLDQGDSWTELAYSGIDKPIRRFGFAGGVFIVVADDSNGRQIGVSSDDGDSWTVSSPAGCGNAIQTDGGIEYGNGTIVILGGDGVACTSTDGGVSWDNHSVGGSVSSQLVWTGSEFRAWSSSDMYASSDGVSWTSTPISPSSVRIGAVAVSDDGVFAAVRGGWQVWYDQQEFYRSTDGVNWEVLDSQSYVGSHPIRFMVFGYGSSSSECPGQ